MYTTRFAEHITQNYVYLMNNNKNVLLIFNDIYDYNYVNTKATY